MTEDEFVIGQIVGRHDESMRWRAVLVPIVCEHATKVGYCVLRDDEGVPPSRPNLPGIIFDPDHFRRIDSRLEDVPEFDVMDWYVIENERPKRIGEAEAGRLLDEQYARERSIDLSRLKASKRGGK